jgi:osmotically inducible protein OsmC
VPLDLATVTVDAHVQMGTTAASQARLAVQLHVNLPGIELATAAMLVAQAHENCPYSRAVSGNIAVDITISTDPA